MAVPFEGQIITRECLKRGAALKTGEFVYTFQGFKPITQIKQLEPRSGLKFQTELGFAVTVFPEQRFAVKAASKDFKFTQARSLEIGDEVLILPSENVVVDYPESEKVVRKDRVDPVNGPFKPDTSFLIGYYLARGEHQNDEVHLTFERNIAAFAFDCIEVVRRELLGRYEYREMKQDPEFLYTVAVTDKVFQRWLEKNHIDRLNKRWPDFLFQAPTRAVAAFLVGYLFGSGQHFKGYEYDFPEFILSELQLLLLREGIVSNVQGQRLSLVTTRSKNEWDRFLAKPNLHKHTFEPWDQERFQAFYPVKITAISEEEIVEGVEVGIEGADGIQVNGFYLGL